MVEIKRNLLTDESLKEYIKTLENQYILVCNNILNSPEALKRAKATVKKIEKSIEEEESDELINQLEYELSKAEKAVDESKESKKENEKNKTLLEERLEFWEGVLLSS